MYSTAMIFIALIGIPGELQNNELPLRYESTSHVIV